MPFKSAGFSCQEVVIFSILMPLLLCGCSKEGHTYVEEEKTIRLLVDQWLAASKDGDFDKAMSLIHPQAQFLVPGMGTQTMDGRPFAEAATADFGDTKVSMDNGLEEIQIMGDWAYVWVTTSLQFESANGDPSKMAGHSLSVLKKEDGRWLIFRDANTLATVP